MNRQSRDTARHSRAPIAPLTETEPEITVADAYDVAVTTIGLRTTDKNRIVGHKIGLIGETRTLGYAAAGMSGMLTLFIRAVMCNW